MWKNGLIIVLLILSGCSTKAVVATPDKTRIWIDPAYAEKNAIQGEFIYLPYGSTSHFSHL